MSTLLLNYSILLAGFAALIKLLHSQHVKGYGSLLTVLLNGDKPAIVCRKHLLAVAILLVTAVFKTSVSATNFRVAFDMYSWGIITSAALLLCMFISLKAFHAEREILMQHFNAAHSNFSNWDVISYLISRALFLVAYEYFFRGILLNQLIADTGITAGITINVLLYMLAHWFSSKKEIIGCIPFGIIMCWFSIASGSILPAVLLHLALSLTYEGSLFLFVKSTAVKHLQAIKTDQ